MQSPIIAFISDFGLLDPYVGIVKGVIAGISPDTNVIDITHEIPVGDIRHAAVVLWQASPYFPSGTIFLGVIDPGVGTSRKPIICRSPKGFFVGPDNGLVSYLWQDTEVEFWEISPINNSPVFYDTFHGRDIFAPVAAHLARGAPCKSLGKAKLNGVTLESPLLKVEKNDIRGEVLYCDHIGNIITSIGKFSRDTLTEKWILSGWDFSFEKRLINLSTATVTIGSMTELSFINTYANIQAGSICALVGSSGLVEIASNRVSAASLLSGLQPGAEVIIKFSE